MEMKNPVIPSPYPVERIQYDGKAIQFANLPASHGNQVSGSGELSARVNDAKIGFVDILARNWYGQHGVAYTFPLSKEQVDRLKDDGEGGFLLN